MDPTYATIARSASAETEVKRSRFLAIAVRVEDDASARGVIIEARKRNRDAGHHCSAFVLGPTGQIQRTNDDGEPSGTAGAPMLEIINGRGLSDVVTVVTRFFGGTLLGAGGLVRAYGDAVGQALDDAGVIRRAMHRVVDVTVPAAEVGRLDNQLRSIVQVRGISYGDFATLTVAVPVAELAAFHEKLAAFTGGSGVAIELDDEWADVS